MALALTLSSSAPRGVMVLPSLGEMMASSVGRKALIRKDAETKPPVPNRSVRPLLVPRTVPVAAPKVEKNPVLPVIFITPAETDPIEFTRAFMNQEAFKVEEKRYTLEELAALTPSSSTLFDPYVYQAVGLPDGMEPMKWFRKCVKGKVGAFLQVRAVQLAAFLKALFEENTPTPALLNNQITKANLSIVIQPVPIHAGRVKLAQDMAALMGSNFRKQIGCSPISFEVEKEVVAVSGAGHVRTSRTVSVFPPDEQGNVEVTIRRSYSI